METKFSVRQRTLGMSECQQLCACPSWEIENLASKSGCRVLPGQPLIVSVGTALNMMIFSTATRSGVETQAMTPFLPGLRNEALLKLGESIPNWDFDRSSGDDMKFFIPLYGTRDDIRPNVSRLLGASQYGTIRQLRFRSESDVTCVSNAEFENGYDDRAPRFTIDAHVLADKIRATCGAPIFYAKAVNLN